MLRMIVAATIAYVLIPENLTPQSIALEVDTIGTSGVSPTDTLSAAGSVIQDIGGFCGRNPEACETGKAILTTVKKTAQQGLDKLATDANQASPEPEDMTILKKEPEIPAD